jgi:hypothetical protein
VLAVNTTLPPVQNEVGPEGVITGDVVLTFTVRNATQLLDPQDVSTITR